MGPPLPENITSSSKTPEKSRSFGAGSSQSLESANMSLWTLNICPTTGGQFETLTTSMETVDGLKKSIAKRLRISKDRITLLNKDKILRGGSLLENGVLDGGKLTLLPNVESGLLSQKPEHTVMQALENLTEPQVNDFLCGRSPLTLAMRLGDHMMFVQLQLSTTSPHGSKRPAVPPSSHLPTCHHVARPVPTKPPCASASSPYPMTAPPKAVRPHIYQQSSPRVNLKSPTPASTANYTFPASPSSSSTMSDISTPPSSPSLSPTSSPTRCMPASPPAASPAPVSFYPFHPINHANPRRRRHSDKHDEARETLTLSSVQRSSGEKDSSNIKLNSATLAEASRNLSKKLKELKDLSSSPSPSNSPTKPSSSKEVCDSMSCQNTRSPTSPKQQAFPLKSSGAIIESMHHHGQGIFSGTFSGTLNPALQDVDGKPKKKKVPTATLR